MTKKKSQKTKMEVCKGLVSSRVLKKVFSKAIITEYFGREQMMALLSRTPTTQPPNWTWRQKTIANNNHNILRGEIIKIK